ncbi:MAG: bacterial transcriptional activator domain-containing protein, partial [Kangiellaceae bacterium]|nr:bacterial transcriptional activator domain-containing protein [Kangiellaceae bacterium]
ALREREKLRRIYFNVLGKLTEYSRLAGDYDSSIGYAQMILDSEPLREDVHRELMELYELSGQRALALKQFEVCRNLLRKELAIPPMRQTMKLYQSITNTALHPELNLDSEFNFSPEHLEHINKSPDIADSPLEKFDVLSGGLDAPPMKKSQSHSQELVNSAREHLAIADEQLKSSLSLMDVD